MASSTASVARLDMSPRRFRRAAGRDAALMASSIAAVTLAYVVNADATLATAAALAFSTATAMHARLAMGRWRAATQILGTGIGLSLVGAPPRLVGSIIVAGLCASELVAHSVARGAVLRATVWTALVAGVVIGSGIAATVALPPLAALREALGGMTGTLLGGAILLALGSVAEWVFGHTTRLTFAEWLSYDHPLLRQLASSAPGTFQHSVNVGLLAAGAADAIGADGLVARVGGLYHDVGKTSAPQYFIENQNGPNPHDQLPPWESARILRAHVTDGVAMVQAHRMGDRIADFVREHHGTGAMRLLLQRAEALAGEASGDETYRYAGPRPRSQETAVLMIADQLEATARATPPADDRDAGGIVRRTIERIREEGELDDSGLTARDLERLESAFTRSLLAMYHRRLDYPSPKPRSGGRTLPFFGRRRASS